MKIPNPLPKNKDGHADKRSSLFRLFLVAISFLVCGFLYLLFSILTYKWVAAPCEFDYCLGGYKILSTIDWHIELFLSFKYMILPIVSLWPCYIFWNRLRDTNNSWLNVFVVSLSILLWVLPIFSYILFGSTSQYDVGSNSTQLSVISSNKLMISSKVVSDSVATPYPEQ